MNTIRNLSQYALQMLKDSYSEHEIRSICNIIYMDVLHFTNIDIHLRKNEILEESFVKIFFKIISLLQSGQPLQYILGETEFAGLRFRLDSSTLIPRPETEELVHWADSFLHGSPSILDIGTGSGCIAVTLAHLHPQASVHGTDISAGAIVTASSNARLNKVKADWTVRDILHYEDTSWEHYDLIISNPPYVRESEKSGMERKVVAYEPPTALFVPDDDPLLFYRKICAFGTEYLNPQGYLFFEINEAFGKETVRLLETYGYGEVECKKDFYGKDRMVKGKRITKA